MSKLSENYIAVNEGRMARSEFLRQSRQTFPNLISQFTSYSDAIQILKNKGMLNEEIMYQCPGDKFPLEQIEKGLRFELEEMGINYAMVTPTAQEYKKAKTKAIDNLLKDSQYYIKKEACCCDKCKHTQEQAEKAKGEDYKQKKAEGEMQKVTLKEDKNIKAAQRDEDNKAAERLLATYLSRRKVIDPETKTPKEKRSPEQLYQMIKAKYPKFKPSRTFLSNWNLTWLAGKLSDTISRGNAAYRGVGGTVHETKKPNFSKALINEAIRKSITKVLSEAATTNLAQFSDENATIQGIPAILNNLENVVTEIESFIIKEQTKIQGIFDSIGAIKNEDNIPVGYKFVEPIMNSFKQDLQPVLEKVNLDSIKLPTAPESLEQPGAEEMNPEMEAPEEKQTVFTPSQKRGLAESKKGRYTTLK